MSRRGLGLWLASALSLTVLVSACGSSAGAGGVSVVASTNVYGDIAKQIAGDKVSITSIISNPEADPHSYEADTRNQLALSKADVVIENGGGYDDFVDTMLRSARNNDLKLLNVVNISGKAAPAGGEFNEHVWYDFLTVAKLADQLVATLSTLDAADAATFRGNAATFKRKLQQLEATEASIKARHSGAGVAITEPVPLYLLQACGLTNKTPAKFSEAIEEGSEVPATVLQQTMDLFTHQQVKLLAYNEQTAGPQTQKVLDAARANNIAVVPVTETLPEGKDYLMWMTGNLSAVQTALG